MVSEDISGYNINFSAVLRWVSASRPIHLTPQRKGPRYLLRRELGEPQSQIMMLWTQEICQPLPGIKPSFLSVTHYIVTIPTEPLHFVFTKTVVAGSSVTKCIIPCNFQYSLLFTCKALFFQVRIITFCLYTFSSSYYTMPANNVLCRP